MMEKGLGKDWITLKDFQDIGDSTTLTDLSDFDDISGVFTMKMDVIAAGYGASSSGSSRSLVPDLQRILPICGRRARGLAGGRDLAE